MRREATLLGTDESGVALVELDTLSQCLKCSRGQGCGAAVTNALGSSGQHGVRLHIKLRESMPVNTGQKVIIDIDEHGSGWLWAVFGAYGLPLTGLLLATGLATVLTSPGVANLTGAIGELVVVSSALGGLAGGIIAWRALTSRALTCVERSLCLQSARIVADSPSTPRES